MHPGEPILSAGWRAELALGYISRDGRTLLAQRRHHGPLLVQKPLYPEGDAVCHSIILHPPAGVAGGDTLSLHANLGDGAHALLTTPGAGKWYRSAGAIAAQTLTFDIAAGACLEWLPQETIVFDGALAHMQTEYRLRQGARFFCWDIVCLGRSGAGERYTRGNLRLETRISCADRLLWREQGTIAGGSRLLDSPVGLAGHSVFGTLLAVAEGLDADLLARCRSVVARAGEGTLTRLPGLLVARYLGDESEAAREYFVALWRILRPTVAGRETALPRIWRT